MTSAASSTRHHQLDTTHRRRRCRLVRRWLHWRLLLWLAGAGGTAAWLAAQPETGPGHVLAAAAAYLVLLGAALIPPHEGDQP